jgi:hypothetical protein
LSSLKITSTEGVIRGLDASKIDRTVRDRNRWRMDNERLYRGRYGTYEINEKMTQDLKDLCALLTPYKDRIKFVISYDRGYVYTNEFELAEKLADVPDLKAFQIQEIKQVCPPGTIALKDPKWTHRTYFRSKSVTDAQRDTLIEYLKARENVRLGPGLKQWTERRLTNWWSNYTHPYFFIDHNNDGEVLFLNMVVPNITRQTKQIIAK